jgi:hypothetical protein
VEDLEAALQQFAAIASDLRKGPEEYVCEGGTPSPARETHALPDQRLIRSLSTFSLAEEYQVNENAQHYRGYDHRRQVFRIKQPGRWERSQWNGTMTAMMIEDGKCVATGGAGF